ncbi:MAG: cytochrome c nitrite reductase small subunit [Deltaproteobacteria bacterium]|nr:MAG: cytochrome c nitrite reductase small subunit [Deltaproteobacteria bacterium]
MKKKLISLVGLFLIPISIGIPIGIGTFTFYYGKGHSYLLDDPKACINCHVMNDNYKSWIQSSHKKVASCNDCHAPDDFVGKWMSKAFNGLMHSYAFTTGNYPDPIKIKKFNKNIVKNQCISCHQNIFQQGKHSIETYNCTTCHKSAGHRR